MSRHVARGAYIVAAVLVCPLLAWHLAVDATNRGLGTGVFLVLLLGVPVSGVLLAALLLRRRRREATFGVIASVAATSGLVAALVLFALSFR